MKNLFIVIIVLFWGCKSAEKETGPTTIDGVVEIKVDVEDARPLAMSEFFSNVTYLPLKTPNSRPIGYIFKIMPQGDKIVLYDRSSQSVWVFSDSGEYITEVRIPYGRGAGEIEHISDVYFDKEFNVHAMGAFKYVEYDMNGELLNETQFDQFVQAIVYSNRDSMYYANFEGSPNQRIDEKFRDFQLYAFNKDGEIENGYLPLSKNKMGIGYTIPNRFPLYENKLFFFRHLDDTVYELSADTVKAAFRFNFGEQTLTDEVFENRYSYGSEMWEWSDFWDAEVRPYGYITYLSFVELTHEFIFSGVGSGNGSHFMILYNRETGEVDVGEEKFINNIDYGPSPFLYSSSDEYLYSYVNAGDLLRRLNSVYQNNREIYGSDKMKELRRLASDMREESNPVLMRLTFK